MSDSSVVEQREIDLLKYYFKFMSPKEHCSFLLCN